MVMLFTLFFSLFGTSSFVHADELNLEAKSAILVDADSGKILYEKDADLALPPASMTKMMTELLVLEAVKQGKIKWDDIVTASEYAHYVGSSKGSRVFLAEGEKRTVRELFQAMAIYSANDATVALAEFVAGTETNFAQLMNKKAEEYGMKNTHYVTSTGYPADDLGPYRPNIEGENLLSARDAAILAYHLINDYPDILKFTSIPKAVFRDGESNFLNMDNWNWMLPTLVYAYEGVDGLKTGFTEAAGYCFTSTAKRGDIRLISVVFGASSEAERFSLTRKMLDYGFHNYEKITLVEAKEKIKDLPTVPVQKGKDKEVGVIAGNDLSILVKKGEEELYQLNWEVKDNLIAPIKSQQVVGRLSYQYNGKVAYNYLTPEMKKNESINLISESDVEKAGWFRLFFRGIGSLISNLFNGIGNTVKTWLGK